MSSIRVILVEDHQVVRQGLRLLIDSQEDMLVVGEASDGFEALQLVSAQEPDVIIFDITMPNMNGIVLVKSLREQNCKSRLLALTANEDKAYLTELLALGINGYLFKRSAANELIQAIRATFNNQNFLDPEIVRDMVGGVFAGESKSPPVAQGTLSEREDQVLRLIANGYSNKEVASRLGISIKTVETHKARAMTKLQLDGRAELLRYAIRHGWLEETN